MSDDAPLLERTVAESEDGVRLDQVLTAWLGEPRSRAQARINAGEVTVNGRAAAKSRALHTGQRVVVMPPAAVEPPRVQDFPDVPLRYEDEHLVILAKPAGLVVHNGAGVRGDGSFTLVDVLKNKGVTLSMAEKDPERPGIVHRLDRGTSGLMAVAKTDKAYFGLKALLAEHDITREYRAIVEGVPEPVHATIDAPIGRSRANRTRFSVDPQGRRAVSHYDVLEPFGRAALVRVRLETGRTHQVRVHLSAVGHAVAGDRMYGAAAALAEELSLQRPALHACRLGFVHPITGAAVEVEEPLPEDLHAALTHLRQPAAQNE